MQFHWKAEDFLQRIHMDVRPHGKEIRLALSNPDLHQQQPFPAFALARRSFVFARPVDLVILGCCSSDYSYSVDPPLDRNFPMGKSITAAGEPDKSWLHTVLGHYPEAKYVVFIPGCCGSYSERFKKFLQNVFPQHEFIFPDMPNLNENFLSRKEVTREGVESLIKAGVLKI